MPLWLLPLIFGGLASGAGALGSFNLADWIKKQTGAGGGLGTTPKDQESDFGNQSLDNYAAGSGGSSNPDLHRSIQDLAHYTPGGTFAIQNENAIQDALNAQKVYADRNIGNISGADSQYRKTNEALGGIRDAGQQDTAGQKYYRDQLAQPGGPRAISTQTIDQIAAKITDQNNAAAGTQQRIMEDRVGRSGAEATPYYQNIAAQNSQANMAGQRDTEIQAALANSEFAKQIASASAALDQQANQNWVNQLLGIEQANAGYAGMQNAANIDRASLEQPYGWGRLGELLNTTNYNNLALNSGAQQAALNNLSSFGNGLMNIGATGFGNRAALNAAGGQSGLGGLLGSLGGGGGGAAIGGLLGGPPGALAGAGIGMGVGGQLGGLNGGGTGLAGFGPSMMNWASAVPNSWSGAFPPSWANPQTDPYAWMNAQGTGFFGGGYYGG